MSSEDRDRFAAFVPAELREEALAAFDRGSMVREARLRRRPPAPPAEPPPYQKRFIPYGAAAELGAELEELRRPSREAAEARRFIVGEPDPTPAPRRARRRARKPAELRFKLAMAKEARRRERQRDRWSAKLLDRGQHCPAPRVVTGPMWEAAQLTMSDNVHAPKALLQELPVGLAERFLEACRADGADPCSSVFHRRALAVLLFLYRGARKAQRPGFRAVTLGFGRGLIAACLPRPGTWGGTYRLSSVKASLNWIADAGLVHRHQPPHLEHFERLGLADPLPPWARGPSGQAYNEYWFPTELVRGPRGKGHVKAGLWGFSTETLSWLLDVDAGAVARELLEETAADLAHDLRPDLERDLELERDPRELLEELAEALRGGPPDRAPPDLH